MTPSAFRHAVEDILGIPNGSLSNSDGRESIPSWDSIADVQILAVISGEMGIEAEPELLETDSFGDLVDWLLTRDAFDDSHTFR